MIQQKSTVQEYNIAFEKLTMQTSDLPLKVEMYYYLKGLKQELRQLVESNRDNLRDMITLKLACLRQDHIINATQAGSTKKKNEETALMISNQSIVQSNRGGMNNRRERGIFIGRGTNRGGFISNKGSTRGTFRRGINTRSKRGSYMS